MIYMAWSVVSILCDKTLVRLILVAKENLHGFSDIVAFFMMSCY